MTTPERGAFRALPGYPLAGIPERRRRLAEAGVDLIDLGAGDSDLPPPPQAVEAMRAAAADPTFGRYPFQLGLPAFREAVAEFMERRFGVSLDPYSEILPLIGSKEGIAHLPLAYLDPGDTVIVPDPGYQAYAGGTLLAGGRPLRLALRPENDFLVPFEDVDPAELARTRILFLNYPNNPTSASAPDGYFERAVAFCREHDVVLAHDHAYSEIAFDGYRPPSVLQVEGARDVAVEFHSISKTYNMTGWRLGWVAGNRTAIAALTKVKTFMDTGAYLGVQAAGAAALGVWDSWVPANVARFQSRRDVAVRALREAGFDVEPPRGTMYLWIPVPEGSGSLEFAERALDEQGVIVLPGKGLGEGGEGFFRIALTVSEARLGEAVTRLGRLLGQPAGLRSAP